MAINILSFESVVFFCITSIKLLKEQSQDDIITCFRDVVNNSNVSTHSSYPGTQASCSDTSSEYLENGYLDNN